MGRSVTNNGIYRRLEDIGLSFDKDMKLTLDSTKFSDALKNHMSDVTALLDTAMGGINTVLSRYTGSSGILSTSLTTIDNQRKSYDQRIERFNTSLTMRKEALYKQYMDYQSQLVALGNTATMFGINLGSTVDTSS